MLLILFSSPKINLTIIETLLIKNNLKIQITDIFLLINKIS